MSNTIKCLIDFIALAIVYFIFFFPKWKIQGKSRLMINTVMYVYLSFVLYFTLMPIITSLPFIFNHPYVPMHMQPFDDYFSGRGDSERQILLNVIMMVPFGFLLPLVKKRRLGSCVLAVFLFSLGIELVQPLINGSRSSDITDVITNTTGGILGYGLYLLFRPFMDTVIKHLSPQQ